MNASATHLCPTCGQHGVPLIFGRPTVVLRDAAAAGDVALGGCYPWLDTPEDANRSCPDRHEWNDADETAVDAEYKAAIARAGSPVVQPPHVG